MSALGHWSPIFLDVNFLPAIVFPFIKVIPGDDLFVFEIIMSLICQWMQVWFEHYPSEPFAILQPVEQLLEIEEPRLAQFFKEMGWTSQIYAWPLLTSLFTDSFSKDNWVKIFDHLFLRSEEPELLFYFLVAYLISSKASLLQIGCIEDMTAWLH